MTHDISIKELRRNLADVADRVEKGESFRVIRRSKPSFFLLKMDSDLLEPEWESVVDFTEGGKTAGMPIGQAMKIVKKIRKS